jgi:hypothetical protein
VDQAVAALGGDRFLHMRYRMSAGRVYAFFRDQMSGLDLATIWTEYLDSPPAKGLAIREREYLGKKQDYSYLFLSDQGWDITFRGARPIPDEDWQRYARSTENDILYMLRARHNEPGMTYDFIRSDVYLSTHIEVVEITDAQGQTVQVFFDHNTKLPIRQTFEWRDPNTRERNQEVTDYSKYRDAGGVMWPYSIERARNGYKSYQMFANEVKVGEAPPPNAFELPPGTKTLKKID